MKAKPNYDLLFNRNHYDGKWYCFRRMDHDNYFNDRNNKDAKIESGSTADDAFKNWNKKYENK